MKVLGLVKYCISDMYKKWKPFWVVSEDIERDVLLYLLVARV